MTFLLDDVVCLRHFLQECLGCGIFFHQNLLKFKSYRPKLQNLIGNSNSTRLHFFSYRQLVGQSNVYYKGGLSLFCPNEHFKMQGQGKSHEQSVRWEVLAREETCPGLSAL